jgi:folate-dependent phosphoribosylglycinamide formyltransferase PurN
VIKRIVAVGHDNSGSRLIFQRLVEDLPEMEFSLAVTDGLYYRKTFIQSMVKLLRESSIIFCGARAIDMIQHRLGGSTLAEYARSRNISLFRTLDINSQEALQKIRSYEPDLIVALYTMHIFKRPVLEIPKCGAITAHPSILPDYRGLEVFFWAMANGDDQIGVSTFTIEPTVDYGPVMNEVLLPIGPTQSMQSVYRMITVAAADLLVKSVRQLNDGTVTYRQPVGEGRYYGMPTRAAVRRFLKLGKRFF